MLVFDCRNLLEINCRKMLENTCCLQSHDEAMKKAKTEYRKYQEITLSPVEEAYMKTIHDINATAKKEVRKSNRR